MNEAEQIVDELSIKAVQQKKLLTEKQKEADLALDEITKSMAKAHERREDAERLKVKLVEKDVVLMERKKNVQMELGDIQPMVDAAKTAVGKIRKDSLNELRMMRLPPEAINDVLSGVLILMGNFDTSWRSMKSFLAKPSIKQEIMNYDARRITPQIRKKANQLLQEKADSFEPKRIQRVSVAAAPLAAWFKANVSYSVILEKIAPLENELHDAQDDIDQALAAQHGVEQELVALDGQVTDLKVNFSKITSEAEALKISLKNVQGTLERSQTLLQKLSEEKHRWDEQVNEIENVTVLLPNYCLLVANFVTYLGGYPENIRVECMDKWKQKVLPPQTISEDDIWNALRFMNNESDLLQWKAEGLPDDELSYQNAMIILNSALYPFIIDPNGDATKWLTHHLKAQNISHEMIQQTDPRFIKQLELSVRFGKTLLVTDVDTINPCLYQLLRKDLSKQGARQVISVGDKFIDYNANFKLYLITRNSNFSLPSRCKPLVTELNFCVTKSGLESQILAITLRSEQPELEKKKSALLQQEELYKMQLAELEKELLEQLAMSKGNILENAALIESLNNTKIQSQNIKKALDESKIVQDNLNKQREIYRVLAVIGSNAYFTIKSLQSLNHMYKFSLSTFLSLFQSNLSQNANSKASAAEDEKSTKKRILKLEQQFVAMIYRNVSRSLFKSDRLTFGLHLVHSLYPSICKENEWEYFVGEIIGNSPKNMMTIPSWIKYDIADSFKCFCNNFEELTLKCEFKKHGNEWSHWIRSNDPESTLESHILCKLSAQITDFEQLLLIQTLRKDRLSIATNQFIFKYLNLNSKSSTNVNVSLKELYEKETSSTIPILFVITPGADPSTELRELALNIVGKDNYNEMAMGSGQQYDAINLIKISSEKGHWICLKNLHLVIPWIKELEQLLSSLSHHTNFRLWLTTESHAHFPSILLTNALKITCEPPPGLKQNLTRTLSLWSDEYMAMNNNPIRAQLLFVLSWFHGIIQERRTYIPCGWNKYYEFNEADLRASMDIIDSIFDKPQNVISCAAQIPWKLLWGLLSLAIYGGRIDNDIDFATMNAYLNSYFNAKVIGTKNANNKSDLRSIAGAEWLQHLPQSTQKYEYNNLVSTIPDSDSPNIFGLPLNANNIVSLQNAKQLLQRLKLLSVVTVIGGDTASVDKVSQLRQTQRKRMEPIINLWKELQASNAQENKTNNIKKKNPVINAIGLEIEKVHAFIGCINKSIIKMEKALFGNGALNMELQEDIKEIMSGIVPWRWNKHWNKGQGPSNPQIFLSELMKRKQALLGWMDHFEDNSFWKLDVVIGHCFYPMTFLNAFKQHSAHLMHVTMDDLHFECVWDKQKLEKTKSPILNVNGLYIQGALFDGKRLKSVSAKDGALSKAPICFIYYDQREQNEKDKRHGIDIPVYYSLDRSYKVCDVSVQVQDKSKWSLSGLAFIMTNSY